MNKYTVEVKENENNELYIEFPDQLMDEMGWKIGDTLMWSDNKDGSFSISKKNTQWVLVESVSTFRHRYLVEVPYGNIDWASDTVVCNDAKEVSQKFLDETIVSSRYVSYDDAINIASEDNPNYDFNDEKVIDIFLTKIENVS